jgi:SM-20-related protein
LGTAVKGNFLSERGLYVVKSFLNAAECAEICAEMRDSVFTPSRVERKGLSVLDDEVRRNSQATVSAATYAWLDARVAALKDPLADHFRVALATFERLTFLLYRQGDFFLPHIDSGTAPETPDLIKSRKVVLSLFLNDERLGSEPGSYGGGSLTFYGLIPDPPWSQMGFAAAGHAGLLIAFPATMIHEVTPITRGERLSVVTRFS